MSETMDSSNVADPDKNLTPEQVKEAPISLSSEKDALLEGKTTNLGQPLAQGESNRPAPPSADVDTILEAIHSLADNMATLQQGFESKIKYDASKERMVDALHKELQTYREDLHFKILRPVFVDLINMYDDLGNLTRHIDKEESVSESERNLRHSLSTFCDTIEEILARNGVTLYSESGPMFVPQRQRVVKTIDTVDPGIDSQIAERIRKGFQYEARIIRPEIVHTFKLKANSQANELSTKKEA